jgi:uncharacterized protein YqfA (UPF0365 family)
MISGVLEALFELIPLGKWIDTLKGNGKSAVGNLVGQVISEAEGEA